MIDLKPNSGRCSEQATCKEQRDYMRENAGKWKTKFEGGNCSCYFCRADLKSRIYMEGIKLK